MKKSTINWEQKYKQLLRRHQALQQQHDRHKQETDRKVKQLRCQLKHTLKYVGIRIEKMEGALRWYQQVCSHLAAPERETNQASLSLNSSTLTSNESMHEIQSSQKVTSMTNSTSTTNSSMVLSPIRESFAPNETEQDWKRSDNHPQDEHTTSNLQVYLGGSMDEMGVSDLKSEQNAIVSRLNARLDTMSQILQNAQNELVFQTAESSVARASEELHLQPIGRVLSFQSPEEAR